MDWHPDYDISSGLIKCRYKEQPVFLDGGEEFLRRRTMSMLKCDLPEQFFKREDYIPKTGVVFVTNLIADYRVEAFLNGEFVKSFEEFDFYDLTNLPRLVKNYNGRIFDEQQCPYCLSFVCNRRAAQCKCCHAIVCHGYGLSRGQCPVCYVGLLPGWSGDNGICCYKGCGKEAVARGRGRKFVCKTHADHQKIGVGDFKQWVLVHRSTRRRSNV